jgi:hypothetical protein
MAKLYKALMLVAALVGMIATVWSVILQFRAKRAEVTVEIRAMEELTPPNKLPDLSATFSYKGQLVDRLWKVTLNLVNSGDKTLVGEGNQKTLIADDVTFAFPAGSNLLDLIVIRQDFPASLVQKHNAMSLKFTQWRKSEALAVSCFVATSSENKPPRPFAEGRSIIDGDIVVRDVSGPIANPKRGILDYLPTPIATPTRAVGSLSAAIWGCILFMLGLLLFRDFVRIKAWKRRQQSKLQAFLSENPVEPSRHQSYLRSPNLMPAKLWAAYPGEKIDLSFVTTDFGSPSVVTVFAILLMTLGAATVLVAATQYIRI